MSIFRCVIIANQPQPQKVYWSIPSEHFVWKGTGRLSPTVARFMASVLGIAFPEPIFIDKHATELWKEPKL